jgi:lipopolysaccharide/colanic/teichoic acid biosynthesis glycosyltransferase
MTRATDLALSLIAIIMLLPVFLPIILILRITGEGEVFYKQLRIGRNNKTFYVLKFATMLKNSPNLRTGTITIKDDPRVLPFGKFLRKTKINELPQLFNIFLGQMSVIGPRPLTEETFKMYTNEGQLKIVTTRPGLSGLGSIFFRSEDLYLSKQKYSETFYRENIAPYKESLEVWYIDNVSYTMYWKLIILTLFAVIFPKKVRIHKHIGSLPRIPSVLSTEYDPR